MRAIGRVARESPTLIIIGFLALALSGCSAPAPLPTASPTSEQPSAWRDDEQVAEQTEWCKRIDAAWDAYFGHGDDDAAVAILEAAATLEPASFGSFEAGAGRNHQRAIDRNIRFIDGGPDSQYIEYTTNGCWDWADDAGVDLGDKAVDPIRLP